MLQDDEEGLRIYTHARLDIALSLVPQKFIQGAIVGKRLVLDSLTTYLDAGSPRLPATGGYEPPALRSLLKAKPFRQSGTSCCICLFLWVAAYPQVAVDVRLEATVNHP